MPACPPFERGGTAVHEENTGSPCWFEKLYRIPVRILELDLPATGTGFHLVAKADSCAPQFGDEGRKIRDRQHHSIPAARLLALPVRHRTGARCAWPAEQNVRVTKGHVRKRWQLLALQLESESLRIKRHRASHILHLISNTMNALDECVLRPKAGLRLVLLVTVDQPIPLAK